MAPIPTPPVQPDDAPDSYVGLDEEHAVQLARGRGWSPVRALPTGTVITMEFLSGRLNFEVDGGKVVRCWPG
ncbi:I78 family peptidase inhibitor [Streptomyces sp. NBC_01180]|uniref:I78 family peptidase inhibitor n=1 Tax=Streptomyces sp. NBC_01180 TaxID=2903763 RepID=UPI00386E2D11|nr:I78 family peptidase inhibitor [Streptomyces sp. NBC_01180]